MLQFIPLTDARLERDPALYERLVPFNLDYPCRRLACEPDVPVAEANVHCSIQGDHHE